LSHRDAEVSLREFVGLIPTNRTKFFALLDNGVEEAERKTGSLPDASMIFINFFIVLVKFEGTVSA
jgi:hypothetical protein